MSGQQFDTISTIKFEGQTSGFGSVIPTSELYGSFCLGSFKPWYLDSGRTLYG